MAYIPSQSNEGSQGRTQGRNLEEGTEVEAMKDAASRLAPHGWLNLAFSDAQDSLPKGGATHRGLAPPSSTIVEENAPQACRPTGLPGRGIFSAQVSYSQITLAQVTLTTNTGRSSKAP